MNEVLHGQAVTIVIGLGSNIEPRENMPRCMQELGQLVELLGVSRVYETEPVAAPGSPSFLNAAVLARTDRTPDELKAGFRDIESQLGRVRDPANKAAPRPIDIDLLLYGSQVVRDEQGELLLPHPDLETYAYVALPLADLAADLPHPISGASLASLADRFRDAEGVVPTDLELDLA